MRRACTCNEYVGPEKPWGREHGNCHYCWAWAQKNGGAAADAPRLCRQCGAPMERCGGCKGEVWRKSCACAGRALAGARVRILEAPLPAGWPGRSPPFNCGLAEHEGGLWLAYRLSLLNSGLGLVPLGDDFAPAGPARLLAPRDYGYGSLEDPRLISHGGRLLVGFVGAFLGRQPIDQVLIDAETGRRWNTDWLGRGVLEKNWAWFSRGGELYAVYTVSPHRILRLCEHRPPVMVAEAAGFQPDPWFSFRGGAPPVLHGGEYYHWFHGRRENGPETDYWVGLYTFAAEPPFAPRRYVPVPLLVPDRRDRPNRDTVHVIFPGGALFRGGAWHVAFGYYDTSCRLATFDAAAVEALLVPVP